jgi:hypothetical protein
MLNIQLIERVLCSGVDVVTLAFLAVQCETLLSELQRRGENLHDSRNGNASCMVKGM